MTMLKTVARFDFESRGLESVSQRVTDLRGALTEFEGRYKNLSEASHTVSELQGQTRVLAQQIRGMVEASQSIETEIAKRHSLRPRRTARQFCNTILSWPKTKC